MVLTIHQANYYGINLDKEHENEEDEEFKGDTSVINDRNEAKLSKDKT